MSVLTLTAATAGDNTNTLTFAGGSRGVERDTIANAELLKGLATTSRLYTFLTTAYASKAAAEAALAAAGGHVTGDGLLMFEITASASVPSLVVITTGTTGTLRFAIGHSLSA